MTERARPKVPGPAGVAWARARSRSGSSRPKPHRPPARSNSRRLGPVARRKPSHPTVRFGDGMTPPRQGILPIFSAAGVLSRKKPARQAGMPCPAPPPYDDRTRGKAARTMPAQLETEPAWQWPADVLALAAEQGVTAILDPLLEATRRLFPMARSLKVYVQQDPEIRDWRSIVFKVEYLDRDIPDFIGMKHRWTDELMRL